mmetsp:Transcript_19210/g.29122  ORF Transcript_19210/g.29122 Transcript_19210/m.29122 type:complete len:282 (-) Transcript_19210:90-935(-)|eukprot:CAMPEP_0197348162 /NCGR_PEP_ID=MMETSP0893-20130614/8137_1 /TAXON_ID=44058 ORGANISM="Aureoumbra lagunensis, Strain CCMP1510" /NCGR_SAMPLE_ID=MMETSP0893 /ASSEMBLY_ACC=CAM_ASM_000539 /LENGTH=281 /DNA_ID=CAMNT_0042858491 /DNA_START=57 /DNA_END=902 /DNA_ORIENTATION=-
MEIKPSRNCGIFALILAAVVALAPPCNIIGKSSRIIEKNERCSLLLLSRRDMFVRNGILSTASLFLSIEKAAADDSIEEVSGLIVLRVAEVASFQERLLRAFAEGVDFGVPVTWQQFAFGTEILLRNTNLDGNLKLMIETEVPRSRRREAAQSAADVMNGIQDIAKFAIEGAQGGIDLKPKDAVLLADLYASLQGKLLRLFAYLPMEIQDKYQGYAKILRDFELSQSAGCEGGTSGGCLNNEEQSPSEDSRGDKKPKPGKAPAALGAALMEEQKKRNKRIE